MSDGLHHPYDLRTRAHLARRESRKWSLHEGTIGAWVAEMDFGTAPAVHEALHRAVHDELLGYLAPSLAGDLGEATADWMLAEHGWRVDPAQVHPVSDVMAGLRVAVEAYSAPGSAVIVPTPAYMPFLTYPPTFGREVVEVPGIVEGGRWRHDLDAIDAAFAAGAGTLVLCNPHNPTGAVLDRDELLAIAELVDRRGGRVFADEIHASIRYDDAEHVPYASVSEAAAAHTITGTSASKAFNVPGMKAAQLVLSNDEDERRYDRFGFSVVHGAATLGVIAAIAAYRDGRGWLDDTLAYLADSRRVLAGLVAEHLPEARYTPPDATYLAWLDLGAYGIAEPAAFLRERAGVVLTDGALCGVGSEQHVRMVFATPRPILREAVEAMGAALRRH